MKLTLIILAAVVFLVIAWLFVMGVMSRSGSAPGISAGSLADCPDKPNCVRSEVAADAAAYIQPLPLPSSMEDAAILQVLTGIVQALGGQVQSVNGPYAAATFSSAMFGFVDDLEIRIARDEGVIHIRSGSRVGYSDAGVNRKRVESLRARFLELVESD